MTDITLTEEEMECLEDVIAFWMDSEKNVHDEEWERMYEVLRGVVKKLEGEEEL